jgi:regulator of sigma E protease
MITVLSFLVVLGILVTVHEIGHLVAAKKLGVKVETFAIGFGPKIAGIRRGETDYVLRLVPLGGYVSLGEAGPSVAFIRGSRNYAERPPLDKIIVAVSGPAANFVLAVLVLIVVSLMGVTAPAFMDRAATVGWVAPSSPAHAAGVAAGDTIISVDGNRVATWQEMNRLLSLYERDVVIEVERAGNARVVTIPDASRLNAGVFPEERITVAAVAKGSPAEAAGLMAGDIIRSAGGHPIAAWAAFQHAIAKGQPSRPLDLVAERSGKIFSARITPRADERTGKVFVGISYAPQLKTTSYTLQAAVKNGFLTTVAIIDDSVGTIRGLVTGSLSIKMLGGPVAIAKASGSTARNGLIPLMTFLAFLSVQLGIFNLLPFLPIVDGGQITIFLYEAARRRPMGGASLEWLLKAGWAVMAALILFVTYNDVAGLF